jgi:hypothetical protein
MNEMIKPIMMAAPIRSSCSIFSLKVACAGLALVGGLKKKKTIMAATPPMGKLI